MAYITTVDINANNQHLNITASTNPTITEVEAMIANVEAEMDARFEAVGIDTPITDTNKLMVVKTISINGVLAMVLRAIDMESMAADRYQMLYDNAMRRIEKTPAIISETSVSNVTGPSGPLNRGTPRFTRDGSEW